MNHFLDIDDESLNFEELKKIAEEEKIQDTKTWSTYNKKIVNLVKTTDVFNEVQTFKKQQQKQKNSFFIRLLRILGFKNGNR